MQHVAAWDADIVRTEPYQGPHLVAIQLWALFAGGAIDTLPGYDLVLFVLVQLDDELMSLMNALAWIVL